MIGLAKTAAGPGSVELVERPEREPAAGEVLIDVLAAGVCGTDLHIEAGEYAAVPPVTLGHELCGVVRAAGDGVEPSLLGACVVSETFFSTCGACPPCREGRPNLCAQRRSIGTHVDGAFAPRVIVPARNLHRVPEGLAPQAAALAEPLACVCQCMLDPAAVAPGERVLVVGPGPMGVLAAQVARALGGEALVSGLPHDAARLEVARGVGLAVTDALEPGIEFDVAVDASGSAAGAAACLERVRKGGRFVQVGIFGRPITVALDLVLQKEIDISTGFASTPLSWRRAIRMIERGDVQLGPLVTETVALGEWRRVFDDLRASRAMKIVFDPQAGA